MENTLPTQPLHVRTEERSDRVHRESHSTIVFTESMSTHQEYKLGTQGCCMLVESLAHV